MSEENVITTQCEADLDAALDASSTELALLCRSRDVVVAALEGKDKTELENELLVYATHADALRDHHMAMREDFVTNHAVYTQMFTRVELLDQLAQFNFLGATPEDREDFSILWDGVMGTAGDIIGAAASIGGVIYSVDRYRKMSKLVTAGKKADGAADVAESAAKIARASAKADAASDAAGSALKMAKSSKAVAVGGGVFSLAMAGLTIASAVKSEVEYVQSLKTDLGKYADWYAQTRENAILFCYWAKTMRNEIDELKRSFSEDPDDITDDAFIEKLNGFMIQAGELDAQMRLATRMLCDGLAASDVQGYTDLDLRIINHIVGQINITGSTVCADVAAT